MDREHTEGWWREEGGGWTRGAMGIKEGACGDEYWMLYAGEEYWILLMKPLLHSMLTNKI